MVLWHQMDYNQIAMSVQQLSEYPLELPTVQYATKIIHWYKLIQQLSLLKVQVMLMVMVQVTLHSVVFVLLYH